MPTLNEARSNVRALAQKGLDVVSDATLTPAEQKEALDKLDADLKQWQKEVADLEHVDEQRKAFLAASGAVEGPAADLTAAPEAQVTKSLGDQFIESAAYKNRQGNRLAGSVELKTTLTEGTSGTPGGGYAATQIPTLLPGVVDIKFRPLVIADLFAQGAVSGNPHVSYLVETTATNAAATVAEAAAKPESALALSLTTENLSKIATTLPVSDEMLEDYDQVRSYINNRLTLFVQITEENQLLTGNGTAPNLTGILNRSGLATSIVKGTAPSAAGDNTMDVLFRQITAIRTTSFLEPDAIVMHPTDWMGVSLLKASGTGNYLANGPFMNVQQPMLWGYPVVLSLAITAGTALVGAFKQAGQVWRKGGITIDSTNSNASEFVSNITRFRAEERLGLAVYRPGAFGTVTGL
jgi:HK97 family phage major capsid protein